MNNLGHKFVHGLVTNPLLVLLVVMVAAVQIATGSQLNPANLRGVFLDASIIAIVAIPIAMLVIAGSLIGFTIYLRLLRDWGAFRAGLYAFISPVIAVGAGVVVLAEPFGPAEAAGALLMFAAAAIALRR